LKRKSEDQISANRPGETPVLSWPLSWNQFFA